MDRVLSGRRARIDRMRSGGIRRVPGVLRLLPLRIRNLIALAPSGKASRDVPERTPAQGTARLRVGLVTGCVQRAFFGEVNEATVRTLAADRRMGVDVAALRDVLATDAAGDIKAMLWNGVSRMPRLSA